MIQSIIPERSLTRDELWIAIVIYRLLVWHYIILDRWYLLWRIHVHQRKDIIGLPLLLELAKVNFCGVRRLAISLLLMLKRAIHELRIGLDVIGRGTET